jgi:alpha-L-rhamnosidase
VAGVGNINCGNSRGVRLTNLRCEYRVDPLGIDTERPRLSWVLESGERGQGQTAYRILVADRLEKLARDEGNLWDSGRVASTETIQIEYEGSSLTSGLKCFWKVRIWDRDHRPSKWSRHAFWECALLEPEDWKGTWISDGKPVPVKDEDFYREDPAPLFRRAFAVDKEIARARLYITGLGYYEARINGRRVGDQVLDPGWTDYRDRVFYSTYDVTDLLQKGENCLGIMLGNGWYNPLPLRMWGRLNLREHLPVGRPCLIAQLELGFADGTRQALVSDSTWKFREGPIRRNNIYLGELYDSRLEVPGWDLPGFEGDPWENAKEATAPGGRLQAQPLPPVRATEELDPIAVTQPRPGTVIYDMGENFSGWIRLRVGAPTGTEISLRYGELLYPDGTLNPMTSVAGQIKGKRRDGALIGGPGSPETAEQRDVYFAKGLEEEFYSPRFTFHAFRYVEVTGYTSRPELEDLTGFRLHSDVEAVGFFECSDPLFNRIQDMTRRTFLSNIFSVQSDCPHRERFGYGGDLAVTGEAFMLNYDMAAFYAKAVRDWHDAALPDGMLTDTAPFVGIQYCGVAWAMVHPLLQRQLHRYYGERRLIEEQYPTSRRWLDLVAGRNPEHIILEGLSDHEGLEPAPAPKMVTPLYLESARLLAWLAGFMGQTEDQSRYEYLADAIQAAYLAQFLGRDTGRIEPVSQAGQAFALALDLLPREEREAALDVLLREIEEVGGHLTTGIFGTRFLLDALSQAGHADTVAEIIRKKTFPGWAFMLEQGATTLWEHWEFSDNTFSHNHPMFGSVSEWFFKWLAGIQPHPEAVGFDRILIRPQPVTGVDWAEARYASIRGEISVHWKKKKNKFFLRVIIPPNTRAEIYVPTSDPASVREGNRPASSAPGLRFLGQAAGCAVFQAESGVYEFSAKALSTS